MDKLGLHINILQSQNATDQINRTKDNVLLQQQAMINHEQKREKVVETVPKISEVALHSIQEDHLEKDSQHHEQEHHEQNHHSSENHQNFIRYHEKEFGKGISIDICE